jgi:hypothetical protein
MTSPQTTTWHLARVEYPYGMPVSIASVRLPRIFTMRKVILFMVPIIPILSGCAGSVIFGHTIGQNHPASTVQVPAPEQVSPAPASTSAPAPGPAPAPALSQPKAATHVADAKLRSATITFTADAKEKIDADPRFNGEALLATIIADLRSHGLIDDSGDAPADHTIDIVIDNFVTRPASNAVLFGYVLSNATLSGNIKVRDAAGRELALYQIKADSHLTAPANGEQAQPLHSLYRRFADLTVSTLTGVPIESPDSQMPR